MTKKLLKIVSCVFLMISMGNAWAIKGYIYDCSGIPWYVGVMGGLVQNNVGPVDISAEVYPTGVPATVVGTSSSQNQWAVRAYIGYRFYTFMQKQITGSLSGEVGGAYYSLVHWQIPNGFMTPGSRRKTGIATVDFSLRPAIKLGPFLEVFGRAGPAVIYQGTSRTIRPAVGKSKYQTYVRPSFGGGIAWFLRPDIGPEWGIDASFMRITNIKLLGNINFYAIGIFGAANAF